MGAAPTCSMALSKVQTDTYQSRVREKWRAVTHLDGLHDRLIQIREAREPEHHAVDQLRQLLQAAGP